MGRYPAGKQLRVGKFSAPEEIGGAVYQNRALLREGASRGRVLDFHFQRGRMDLTILIRLDEQHWIQVESAHLMRADYGSLPQFLTPTSHLGGNNLQHGFIGRVCYGQHG